MKKYFFLLMTSLFSAALAAPLCQSLVWNNLAKPVVFFLDSKNNELIGRSDPLHHGFSMIRKRGLCLINQKMIAAVGDEKAPQWFISQNSYDNQQQQPLLKFPDDFVEYTPLIVPIIPSASSKNTISTSSDNNNG